METKVKTTVSKCEPDAPLQVPLKKYDQYDSYEMEANYDQTVLLLENLNAYGNTMHIITEHLAVDFYLDPDNTFEVEIFDSRNGFTAIAAMLDPSIARKILEMAFDNEIFTDVVPTTDQPWWTSAYV